MIEIQGVLAYRQHIGVHIRAQDPQIEGFPVPCPVLKIFKGFKDEGEGFLAGRAAGTPEANRRRYPVTCFCMNLWQDYFAEKRKIN